LGRQISKLIPDYIQIGTTVGIGLITALSGYTELDIVVQGRYTLVAVGPLTLKIYIAISGLILIALGVYYHSRFAYLLGLAWGTFLWWSSQDAWPKLIGKTPQFEGDFYFGRFHDDEGIMLTFEMIFLVILTLFGLAKALCELASISSSNASEAIPKGRLLLVVIGIANIASGCLFGPPIILSPETASGIKAGARTGLSAVVTGILFVLSVFFAPIFTAIPAAATSPVLIMIGMILFQNVKVIDFTSKYGIAAFICLTLIPFTDSIFGGLGFGYVTFLVISILNGDVMENVRQFLVYYLSDRDGPSQQSGDKGDPPPSLRRASSAEGFQQQPSTGPQADLDGRGGDLIELGMMKRPPSYSDLASHQQGQPAAAAGDQPIPREGSGELSFPEVVHRARRNTMQLLQSVMADVDLENDILKPDLSRF
jgi:xanthine/uracil/vitamin C permease (AzgA family)